MKKVVILLFMGLVALFSCNKENEDVALSKDVSQSQVQILKSSSSWHALSQPQRDQAILTRAYQDNGKWAGAGQDCKNWARTVVLSASGNVVWLPSTNTNNYTWASDPNIGVVPSAIAVASPGNIVQMALNNGTAHTAIIYARDYTYVTFIESNWCLPATCNMVRLRKITFSQFQSQVTGYSIYYVK